MRSRLSLANKCLAIFGCAIVVIIASTLAVPWARTSALVQEYQLEVAGQLADLWINSKVESKGFEDEDVIIQLIKLHEIGSGNQTFIERARNKLLQGNENLEYYFEGSGQNQLNFFQYAQPITSSQLSSIQQEGVTTFNPGVADPSLLDPVDALLIVKRKTGFAQIQIETSRNWIVVAGLIGSILSALIFFVILKRLIFSPVRKLRRVSERVQQGDLTARSTLETGDEFEELSIAFNNMLDWMEADQQKLQKMNESLDLKVEELAEVNVGLFESGKLKNEFIANVSHELRTPLNSIIGFAELLESMPTETEEDRAKRLRYLKNILTSGRSLLDMINELLDMAKIESGRMEVNLEQTCISDLLEGLGGIMRPQAKVKNVTIKLEIENDLPSVQTDPGKLQQILYNFLSNAIKFTPKDSTVTILCKKINTKSHSPLVQICVQDCGPGIPEDMIDMVFEKFRQVDATHTREHAGTGLGLAICRELAELLHASLSVHSTSDNGALFYVDIPVYFATETPEPLMPA
ncbi:MAG: HAMP domain-containing histidine kinase [Phycisphaerales bacterium]|nr:HAMP domain-containing histidine kinase [Planctomycetota bacterium]MBL6996964.1 HAMP domain-containing histidine kinase [Phycisphaerales bacterium]